MLHNQIAQTTVETTMLGMTVRDKEKVDMCQGPDQDERYDIIKGLKW